MGMGPITWACLWLMLGAEPANKLSYMNQRGFELPIQLDLRRDPSIAQVLLYYSTDRGQSWNIAQRVPVSTKAFNYRAPEDGEYWFKVATLNARGERTPHDIQRAPVGRMVVIDTVRPSVSLTAERQGDAIVARWAIVEDHQDSFGPILEYHTEEMSSMQWTPVGVPPGVREWHFNPGTRNQVQVRLKIRDRAGNLGEGRYTVPASGGIGTIANWTTDTPGSPAQTAGSMGERGVTPSRGTTGGLTPPARLSGGGLPLNDYPGSGAASSANVTAPTPLASSGSGVTPATLSEVPRGSLPPLQIVGKPQIKLEFEVAKCGPSGLGGVDVYVTTDDGANWERVPSGLNVTLPPASDMHRATPPRGSVLLPLARETTTYGFYLVVKNKAGLGKPAPKTGDLPHVRVELDKTRPEALLYGPQMDPDNHNSVVLYWKVSDRNPARDPINLEWSDRRDGAWRTIAQHLANTGKYSWHLPEQVPSKVYLRLSVRDLAGNSAVAQTEAPVLIDLTIPDARIVGVSTSP